MDDSSGIVGDLREMMNVYARAGAAAPPRAGRTMLSERERRQWVGIEQRLRRDPRFAVHVGRPAPWRMQRWRVIGLGVTVVLGWWLFTPLLALW